MEQCEWQNDDRNVIIESIMTLKDSLSLVLFLAACFNFSFSLVFVWSCHFSFY